MAAHRCVLVAEHTSEMVGGTRNNDDFDCADYYYDHYFDYDDEFDNDDEFDCADYHDDNYDDDYDIDDNDNYDTNIANPNCDMVTNHCAHHRTITEHTVGCVIFW